ncbi:MAG: TetR/AcrR family transcriptional regulator [Alphaproteobacteria bacterium]
MMQRKIRQNTKEALIRAAERLFAEKGLGTVSVRDITRAAGARNESALHYHFGGVEALIREVFANRYRDIEEARLARLAEFDAAGKNGDIQAVMEVSVGPLFQACSDENGRLYAHFLAQLVTDPRFDLAELVEDFAPSCVLPIADRALAALGDLPAETVRARLRQSFTISIILTADYVRRIDAGDAPPVDEAVREAAACLAGFLRAMPG